MSKSNYSLQLSKSTLSFLEDDIRKDPRALMVYRCISGTSETKAL